VTVAELGKFVVKFGLKYVTYLVLGVGFGAIAVKFVVTSPQRGLTAV